MTTVRDLLNDLTQQTVTICSQAEWHNLKEEERDELIKQAIDETLESLKERIIG
jgi:uncharacterized protein YbcI